MEHVDIDNVENQYFSCSNLTCRKNGGFVGWDKGTWRCKACGLTEEDPFKNPNMEILKGMIEYLFFVSFFFFLGKYVSLRPRHKKNSKGMIFSKTN